MERQAYIIVFQSKSHASAAVAAIKSYGTWGRISDNSYIIVSTATAGQIRDNLVSKLAATDTVFVLRSGAIAAWSNVPARNDWLKEHL